MFTANIIFILILIFEVAAIHDEEYYNLGTVLFSRDNIGKLRWNINDILLLKAKESLLEVIPPPNIININDNQLAKSLLTYFRETVKTINNKNLDPELRVIVLTAVTDTIGAYMKKWVLPIVKYSYYGGTVPEDDALKIFGFHTEIKLFLNTEGGTWQGPTVQFLNSIAVNVAPIDIRQAITRGVSLGCEDLAYLKKTSSGYTIPVPHVNWDKDSESIFIPFKNGTLISLNSPKASDSLINYYNTAQNCIQTANNENYYDFDERLQKWLIDEILPHLNDEKLYLGMKSILSLLNKTRHLCDTVIDIYDKNISHNKYLDYLPVNISSKKMLVITVIIILEIIWCIPTLCYLIIKMIKRKKNKSNTCCSMEPKYKSCCNVFRKPPCSVYSRNQYSNTSPSSKRKSKIKNCMSQTGGGGYVSNKALTARLSTKSAGLSCVPQTKSQHIGLMSNQDFGHSGHQVGTCTRSNFTCQLNRLEMLPSNDQETSQTPTKLTNSMNCVKDKEPMNYSTLSLNEMSLQNKPSKTASFITVQELQTTKTVTILKNHEATGIKEISRVPCSEMSKYLSKTCPKSSSMTEHSKSKSRKAQSEKMRKPASKEPASTKNSKASVSKNQEKPRQKDKNKSGSILEITIENPCRDICFDIGSRKSLAKSSKIPKRYYTTSSMKTQTSSPFKKDRRPCPVSPVHAPNKDGYDRRTNIPQWKRPSTVDDIAVVNEHKKPSHDSKLNVSL